jgi:hypothetical protein
MGLAISVGFLADLLENDPEFVDDIREEFRDINRVLRACGYPDHLEPETLPPLDDGTAVAGFPYSCLHTLRRIYAFHLKNPGQLAPPLTPGERAAEDPVIEEMSSPDHHVLWHSDAEGYYVPVDFPYVLEHGSLAGGGVGSSIRLLSELNQVPPLLGIDMTAGNLSDAEAARIDQLSNTDHPYSTELMVWLSLYEAARLSVEHGTAVHFG